MQIAIQYSKLKTAKKTTTQHKVSLIPAIASIALGQAGGSTRPVSTPPTAPPTSRWAATRPMSKPPESAPPRNTSSASFEFEDE